MHEPDGSLGVICQRHGFIFNIYRLVPLVDAEGFDQSILLEDSPQELVREHPEERVSKDVILEVRHTPRALRSHGALEAARLKPRLPRAQLPQPLPSKLRGLIERRGVRAREVWLELFIEPHLDAFAIGELDGVVEADAKGWRLAIELGVEVG